jgi:thiol-disulfide isomerase/thioredoxin
MTKLLLLLAFALLGGGGRTAAPVPKSLDARGLAALLARDSGKVVLVNAWASWCRPCREEMPGLLELRKRYAVEGFRLVLLSADDRDLAATDVRRALDSAGVDFETYITGDSTEEAFINGLSPDWGGALPATFLYDRAGKRVAMHVGARTVAQFEKEILPLLRKGP